MHNFLLPFFLFFSFNFFGQTGPLSPSTCSINRATLLNQFPDSSVIIVGSYPVRNKSLDMDYEYHPNPNLYYLTGIKEAQVVLFLFTTPVLIDSVLTSELVLSRTKDRNYEIWNGAIDGQMKIQNQMQLECAVSFNDFKLNNLPWKDFKALYMEENFLKSLRDHVEMDVWGKFKNNMQSILSDFNLKIDSILLQQALSVLREVKSKEELQLMQKAIDITCLAQKELMKTCRVGMTEFQAEAILEYVFAYNGAETEAFSSILGGGDNACVLHYISNRDTLKDGDLLVVDIGAQYQGYAADVTRTIPVNGKYTKEQNTLYNIVLKAQMAGIEKCRAGEDFSSPHKAAKAVIEEELLKLGIIKDKNESRKYFMHGTSHYLGLDVHDVGTKGTLKENSVITVEPGIYIEKGSPCDTKWWGIGIRIEDDIRITGSDPINMSDCALKYILDIEALMKD